MTVAALSRELNVSPHTIRSRINNLFDGIPKTITEEFYNRVIEDFKNNTVKLRNEDHYNEAEYKTAYNKMIADGYLTNEYIKDNLGLNVEQVLRNFESLGFLVYTETIQKKGQANIYLIKPFLEKRDPYPVGYRDGYNSNSIRVWV